MCEVVPHSEGLALSVAVPLFKKFSVSRRRPHRGLAEPPTPHFLSGAVYVASAFRQPWLARGV